MIPATSRRSSVYTGTGAVSTYSFGFKVFADSDVRVDVTDTLGVTSTLALATNYTVARNADQDAFPGGTITLLSPLTLAYQLVMIGSTAYSQTAQLPTGGAYNAVVVERALDRLVMQTQQLSESLGRAIIVPATVSGVSTVAPTPVALKVIGWNSTGTALVNYSASDLATIQFAVGNYAVDRFTAGVDFTAGVTTALNLSAVPGSKNNTQVTFDGAVQHKSQYNVADLVLTFTAPIPVGVLEIEVVRSGALNIGVPSDGAVATAKIADLAVTTSKIADANVTLAKLVAAVQAALVPVGTVITFAGAVAPAGFLKSNGQTIGSAASGATSRANADTQTLFDLLWTQFTDANLPILTSAGGASTRGASSAADFAADKRMTLPDLRGEFIRGLDDGRGVDAARALGSAQAEMIGPHNHPARASVSGFTAGNAALQYAAGDNNGTALVSGGGATFGVQNNSGTENRPRNVALLACIKY